MTQHVDVFIIGGGINGVGIARDAAGRGYSVALCEAKDLASGTSNWSSKLIHGGLRYLEHFDFRLVRKALIEREVLWAVAPHIIHPMRFILPHHRDLRPAWLLRLGLYLYDHLGGRKLLPAAKTVDLRQGKYGEPLRSRFRKGFQYSDCQVDDARLVVLNAMDAREKGAEIAVGRAVTSAQRAGKLWQIVTRDAASGAVQQYSASVIVNAAGPWADQVLDSVFGQGGARNLRMVQGSHIVVPKLYAHDNSYIFQNRDGRIIFAIPYSQDTTLIGTTDRDYQGDPRDAKISPEEIDYLCDAASEYFEQPVLKSQILWSFSGVRPLFDDGASAAQQATRDYVFKRDGGGDVAPLINIFGGKITTYRVLAEKMMDEIEALLGKRKPAWTAHAPLPGGDFPTMGFGNLVKASKARYPFLSDRDADRLCRAYGTNIALVLGQAERADQLGHHFGAGLYETEVRYLALNEWARCANDIVWRRSKLGIVMNEKQIDALDDWMKTELDT